MPDDRTSSGGAAVTLRLLWRASLPQQPANRRGPRRGLDVDSIVAAAVAVADDDGLSALTMRRLAQALGVTPMSLYTYVPGRAELLDLVLDDLYARMPRTSHGEQSWQERVRQVAEDNRALYERHPWAAATSTLRPPLGPGQLAKYEHELAAFTGSGMRDLQVDDALTLLLTFIRANARDAADAQQARESSGADDQRWWEAVAPLLSQVVDDTSYPLATRIGAVAGAAHHSAHDPQHAYAFGLAQILRALEQLAADAASSR